MRKYAHLAGTILVAGCATQSYPQLPSAPFVPPPPLAAVADDTVRDMDPREAVGGALKYVYRDDREYSVFVPYGRIVPISFLPGDTDITVSVANWKGWQLDVMDAGRGRSSKSILVASAQSGARRTTAIVASSGSVYVLDLIPRKSGHTMVIFHKAPPRQDRRMAAPAGPGYSLQGPAVAWRPSRIADDGARTWVTLSPSAGATGMPVIMGLTDAGERRPVNHRRIGDQIVFDGVFPAVEVRLGDESVIGRRG